MNKKTLVTFALSTLFFIGQGCTTVAPDKLTNEPQVVPNAEANVSDQAQDSTFQPFSLSAYTQAKAEGRPILLNFFANWCPTCATQEPRTEALFINKKVPSGISAFRINYNDSETDEDERDLAKQLHVTYQHTYIYFDKNGNETARTIGTTPDSTVIKNLNAIAP
ncbi:MAG: thioredoxin family protein [bacterium]|nr:thioredoxin family protein [bacterium]